MNNKIVIVILSLLLAACATVVPEKVQNRKLIDRISLRFNKSAVTPDEKVRSYVYIQNYDGDKMSSEVVKEFILAYNRTYNTTFNVMRDIVIEREDYAVALIIPQIGGGYGASGNEVHLYSLSGILLEIAKEPTSATDGRKH